MSILQTDVWISDFDYYDIVLARLVIIFSYLFSCILLMLHSDCTTSPKKNIGEWKNIAVGL